MPNYFYTAKSLDGETKTGSLTAQDIHQLAQSLKSEGLVLIKAALQEEKKGYRLKSFLPSFRVSPIEKIMLTRNLWVMTAAGLSLVRSLSILTAQAKNKGLKNALLDIKEEVIEGKSFSEALAKYPNIFSEVFQNMIKVGEESGRLEEVLQVLSLQIEKEHELKSKIKHAMIYPAVILSVMIGIGILVTIVVLPKLSQLFNDLNVELPIYTKIIINFGNFVSKQWLLLGLVLLLFFFVFERLIKTKKGKWLKDTFLIKLPFFSSLVKKNNTAILIRTLSSLITSAVPVVTSLEVTSRTVDNFYFRKALNEAAEKVRKGEKLSVSFKSYEDIFPFGAIEMIEVGEETGKTSTILKKLAEFYEQEAINITENLSVLIEPILVIILGLAVGLFAISVIQPIYSVMGSI